MICVHFTEHAVMLLEPTPTITCAIARYGAFPCAGYSGDGGTATAAKLFSPGGLALDGSDLIVAGECSGSSTEG